MKKAAILAVAIGLLTLAIASTTGSAAAGATSADAAKEPKHTLTFNRGINGAQKIAARECAAFVDCIAYGVLGEQCHSVFKHKITCPIHIVRGTPGNQAAQTDCHRDVKILIKRAFGLKLFFRFTTNYTCGPNVEHPGFKSA